MSPALIELLTGFEGGFLWGSGGGACRCSGFGCCRDGLRRPGKELYDLFEGGGVRLNERCRVRVCIQIRIRVRVVGLGRDNTGKE